MSTAVKMAEAAANMAQAAKAGGVSMDEIHENQLLGKARKSMRQLSDELNGAFFERAALVHALILGLIAKVNVFCLGEPGVAKSDLINKFSQALGLKCFDMVINGDTTPATLFGQPNTKHLEETGRIAREVENTVLDAEVVNLDEFWKGNKTLQNSCLQVFNERKYTEGSFRVDCPIQLGVIAGNEYPKDQDLDAIFDRFPLRVRVTDIEDDDAFEKLAYMRGSGTIGINVPKQEIAALQRAVDDFTWKKENAAKLRVIRAACREEGFHASPRRWMAGIRLVIASAIFRGKDTIGDDDYLILAASLWDNHNDRSKLYGLIGQAVNPHGARMREIMDGATESVRRLPDLSSLKNGSITKAVAQEQVLTVQTELDEFEKILQEISQTADEGEMGEAWSKFNELRDVADNVATEVTRHGRRSR